jgi:hypothetical protein
MRLANAALDEARRRVEQAAAARLTRIPRSNARGVGLVLRATAVVVVGVAARHEIVE